MKALSPSSADRMQVHGAIETLINSHDPDARRAAAQVVIQYGDRLPKPPKYVLSARLPWSSGGENVTGHAAGVGNISVDDKDDKKPAEWRSDTYEADRVGHYRLRKVADGYLEFYHFWASSPSTSGSVNPLDTPPVYAIIYNNEDLEFVGFGIYEGYLKWSLNLWLIALHCYAWDFNVLLGKTLKKLNKTMWDLT